MSTTTMMIIIATLSLASATGREHNGGRIGSIASGRRRCTTLTVRGSRCCNARSGGAPSPRTKVHSSRGSPACE